MKKLTLTLTLLIAFLITSCSNSKYQGEWSGIYSGKSDNGNWIANIDENGTVIGKATSSIHNVTYELTGKVNTDGEFLATYGNVNMKGEFNGRLNENIADGTWANPNMNMSGKFSGNKK